jgi:hypothetical protein
MIEKLTDYNMSVCYEDKQYFLFVILGLSLANMWPSRRPELFSSRLW